MKKEDTLLDLVKLRGIKINDVAKATGIKHTSLYSIKDKPLIKVDCERVALILQALEIEMKELTDLLPQYRSPYTYDEEGNLVLQTLEDIENWAAPTEAEVAILEKKELEKEASILFAEIEHTANWLNAEGLRELAHLAKLVASVPEYKAGIRKDE